MGGGGELAYLQRAPSSLGGLLCFPPKPTKGHPPKQHGGGPRGGVVSSCPSASLKKNNLNRAPSKSNNHTAIRIKVRIVSTQVSSLINEVCRRRWALGGGGEFLVPFLSPSRDDPDLSRTCPIMVMIVHQTRGHPALWIAGLDLEFEALGNSQVLSLATMLVLLGYGAWLHLNNPTMLACCAQIRWMDDGWLEHMFYAPT